MTLSFLVPNGTERDLSHTWVCTEQYKFLVILRLCPKSLEWRILSLSRLKLTRLVHFPEKYDPFLLCTERYRERFEPYLSVYRKVQIFGNTEIMPFITRVADSESFYAKMNLFGSFSWKIWPFLSLYQTVQGRFESYLSLYRKVQIFGINEIMP